MLAAWGQKIKDTLTGGGSPTAEPPAQSNQPMDYSAVSNPVGNPQSPAPLPPSLYETLDPAMAHIVNTTANYVKQQTINDNAYQGALNGQNVDDQDDVITARHLTEQLTQQLMNVDPKEYDAAQKHVTNLIQQHYSQTPDQAVPLQQPSLAQGAVAGLGAILFRRQAGEIAASPFVANQQTRQREEAQREQQFQGQIAGYNSVADHALRMMGITATTLAHNSQVIMEQLTQVNKRMERADQNTRIKGDKLLSLLSTAKDPALVKVYASQLGRLGQGEYALDPETIKAIITDKTNRSLKTAVDERNSYIKQFNADGIVDDKDKAAIDVYSRAIEKQYGLNPGVLGSAPTYTSLAKQRADEHKAEFQQRFQQADSHFQQTYLKDVWNSIANRDLAEQRLSVSQDNAQTARGQLLLSQYNAEAKNSADKIDKAITAPGGLNQQLAEAQSDLQSWQGRTDKTSVNRANAAAAKVDSVKAQIAYLQGLHKPTIEIQTPYGTVQTGIANPAYQAQPQPPSVDIPPLHGAIGGNPTAPVHPLPAGTPPPGWKIH